MFKNEKKILVTILLYFKLGFFAELYVRLYAENNCKKK